MDDLVINSKKILRAEESCTSACMRAMYILYKHDWLLWEPETIWIELNHNGVNVPVGNRNQLMAARSLLTTGRFWYDATAFEVACLAFSNEEPMFMGLEDTPVMQINWAVFEADLIHKEFENESVVFDREPIQYTAIQLYREGFVIAPPMLSMSQDALTAMLPKETRKLADTIHKAWAVAPKGDALLNAAFPETCEGVQLARLAAVQIFFEQRLHLRTKQLAELNGCTLTPSGLHR